MVTNKQRQRQLARAKWERQQAKRMSDARRHRVLSLVVGVIVGLIVVALLGWLVLHIIDQEKSRNDQTPVTPTDSFSTNLLSPSTPPTSAATGKPSTPPTTAATKPTKAKKTGGN